MKEGLPICLFRTAVLQPVPLRSFLWIVPRLVFEIVFEIVFDIVFEIVWGISFWIVF